ncbi:hypothetical protein GCM10023063_45120 [Arthrobacter methylotrophus]
MSAVIVAAALGGCASGAPAPVSPSGPAASRLDPSTEDLSWDNGNRILGDENGGHTPDIGTSLGDPTSGWQTDNSTVAPDGVTTFTSQNTQCKVRTTQMRNQPSELVAGDDRESTLKVLSILAPGEKDLVASAKDTTLSYGASGIRDVAMLSVSFQSGNTYDFTAIRTFSKPAVTIEVEAICPTLDTLKSTWSAIHKSITINAL